jgi:DNA/RNA-binding domain of Phe-tRNA-synthetase-like protein
VDLLNLISLESGFSIGGYDAEKIIGNIEFGVGKENEPYEAIGRGMLNIENLPLFRDDLGAFGSPTSDSLRTMVTDETTKFLMIIIAFSQNNNLEATMKRCLELYEKYANADSISIKIIS